MDNTQNKLISAKQIEDILNFVLDNPVKIINLEYYQKAFVHESYFQSIQNDVINNDVKNIHNYYIPTESNQRLEFLGDSVLKTIIAKYLYMRFPKEREGFLTKMKIKLEQTCTLHMLAKELNFKEFLLLSSQVEAQSNIDYNRGRNKQSFYEDAFEAFIGAIMLDFGYNVAEEFVIKVIEKYVDFSNLIYNNNNFKDSLQRYFQMKKIPLPCYKIINTDTCFTRIVLLDREYISVLNIDLNKFSKISIDILNMLNGDDYNDLFQMLEKNVIIGIGKDKKVIKAEQNCAKNCLENLNIDLNF